jgi:hypothetical protein
VKIVQKKVRIVIQAFQLQCEEGKPCVSACQLNDDGWVPSPVEGAVLSIVEVMVPMRVAEEMTRLPNATAEVMEQKEGGGK